MQAVPFDDRGLLLGDGLFETLLWSGGALVLGAAHAERMARGAAALGLPALDGETFLVCAGDAVAEADLQDDRAAVRVTLTAGSGGRGLDRPDPVVPRLFATAAPAPRTSGPASLAIVSGRRNAASPTSRLKTLAYLDNVLARREARDAGADEAVILDTNGWIAGAAAANLFWIENGVVVTPSLDAGCLDGIMRGVVLAAAAAQGVPVNERLAGADTLATADAVFLTNSLMGVRPVSGIGGRSLAPHGLVEALARAVQAVS